MLIWHWKFQLANLNIYYIDFWISHYFSYSSSLHFLTDELPIEAQLHRDIFSLLYGVWANPDTKIHTMVKYLLSNSVKNSWTWSNHIRQLAQQYGLVNPTTLFNSDAPGKTSFKHDVMTRIRAFHENELRSNADPKKLKYLNLSLLVLSDRRHPRC